MASEGGPGQPENPAKGEEEESLPKYTWEEIAEHRSAESLWVVVHDKVYDITKFMDEVLTHRAALPSDIACYMLLFARLGWQLAELSVY